MARERTRRWRQKVFFFDGCRGRGERGRDRPRGRRRPIACFEKATNRVRIPPPLVARDAIFRSLRSLEDVALALRESKERELLPRAWKRGGGGEMQSKQKKESVVVNVDRPLSLSFCVSSSSPNAQRHATSPVQRKLRGGPDRCPPDDSGEAEGEGPAGDYRAVINTLPAPIVDLVAAIKSRKEALTGREDLLNVRGVGRGVAAELGL